MTAGAVTGEIPDSPPQATQQISTMTAAAVVNMGVFPGGVAVTGVSRRRGRRMAGSAARRVSYR